MRLHFIQLLRLYHNPARDHQAALLCRQHARALLALAGCQVAHVRRRFRQLGVVDFLVREVRPPADTASGIVLCGQEV